MRQITSIAVLTLWAASAGAQQPTQRATDGWPLDMDGTIRIHNFNGTVTVTGWDRDSVAITAVIDGKTLAGRKPLFGGGSRSGVKMGVNTVDDAKTAPAADFTVFVPSRARLSIRGAATTIDIRNFAGTVDASTLSGKIHIAGSVTEITAETMDGDLEVEASPTYLRGKTATGRISWTGSSDDVSLSTVSGTIVATGGTLFRGRFESISGDLKFAGGVKPDGRVGFDTHGGDVTLAFSRETRAEVTVDAPRWNVLGAEPTPSRPAKRAQIFGVPTAGIYNGKARPADVDARSFKGRITVTQP